MTFSWMSIKSLFDKVRKFFKIWFPLLFTYGKVSFVVLKWTFVTYNCWFENNKLSQERYLKSWEKVGERHLKLVRHFCSAIICCSQLELQEEDFTYHRMVDCLCTTPCWLRTLQIMMMMVSRQFRDKVFRNISFCCSCTPYVDLNVKY